MKTTEFEINGRVLHLCLNGAALFDLYDIFGQEGQLIDPILPDTKKGFNATCVFLAKLAEQGELVRRYEGHEPGETPTIRDLRVMLSPVDVFRAKLAIRAAVAQGFAMEERKPKKGKRRDLALEEWERTQKKTTLRSRVGAIFRFLLGWVWGSGRG